MYLDIFTYIIIFLFGSAIGSFLGVIVDRTNSGESYLIGRSNCDFCKKPLGITDLVPIISFVSLGGKCRFCKHKLSVNYLIIEIMTGSLFLIAYIRLFYNIFISQAVLFEMLSMILLFYIISILIVIFFTDIKFGIIPFWPVTSGIIATFGLHIFQNSNYSLNNYIFSAIGAFLGFLIIFLVTKGRGMGFGDVLYVLLMGFLLGFPEVILAIYLAFLSGAIVALILIAAKRKKFKGDSIPFGPFLIFGTIVSFFWGEKIIDFIIRYLLG